MDRGQSIEDILFSMTGDQEIRTDKKSGFFFGRKREREKEGIALYVEVVNVILTADCSRNPIRVPASLFEFIHRAPVVPSNQVIVIAVVVADPREPCSYTWTVHGRWMRGRRISTFSLPGLDCPPGRRLSDVGISLRGRVPFFKTGACSSSSSLAFFPIPVSPTTSIFLRERDKERDH